MLMPNERVNVSGAASYGEVITLFPTKRPSHWDPNLVAEALERIEEHGFSVARGDALLVTGHMAPIVRLACALVSIHPDALGLFYDAMYGEYVARLLNPVLETGNGSELGKDVHGSSDATRELRS